MLDCCVARERLRIVMSSIMRWRRGRVVAIGASCPERGGCDHHILSDGRLHRSDLPAAPKEQVRSMRGRVRRNPQRSADSHGRPPLHLSGQLGAGPQQTGRDSNYMAEISNKSWRPWIDGSVADKKTTRTLLSENRT